MVHQEHNHVCGAGFLEDQPWRQGYVEIALIDFCRIDQRQPAGFLVGGKIAEGPVNPKNLRRIPGEIGGTYRPRGGSFFGVPEIVVLQPQTASQLEFSFKERHRRAEGKRLYIGGHVIGSEGRVIGIDALVFRFDRDRPEFIDQCRPAGGVKS